MSFPPSGRGSTPAREARPLALPSSKWVSSDPTDFTHIGDSAGLLLAHRMSMEAGRNQRSFGTTVVVGTGTRFSSTPGGALAVSLPASHPPKL